MRRFRKNNNPLIFTKTPPTKSGVFYFGNWKLKIRNFKKSIQTFPTSRPSLLTYHMRVIHTSSRKFIVDMAKKIYNDNERRKIKIQKLKHKVF